MIKLTDHARTKSRDYYYQLMSANLSLNKALNASKFTIFFNHTSEKRLFFVPTARTPFGFYPYIKKNQSFPILSKHFDFCSSMNLPKIIAHILKILSENIFHQIMYKCLKISVMITKWKKCFFGVLWSFWKEKELFDHTKFS